MFDFNIYAIERSYLVLKIVSLDQFPRPTILIIAYTVIISPKTNKILLKISLYNQQLW